MKYSQISFNSMRFQKCYNFHCSKCTKSILFQKEDASSSRRKCSQLLRMPNCCQKFLRGTLGKKNIRNGWFQTLFLWILKKNWILKFRRIFEKFWWYNRISKSKFFRIQRNKVWNQPMNFFIVVQMISKIVFRYNFVLSSIKIFFVCFECLSIKLVLHKLELFKKYSVPKLRITVNDDLFQVLIRKRLWNRCQKWIKGDRLTYSLRKRYPYIF